MRGQTNRLRVVTPATPTVKGVVLAGAYSTGSFALDLLRPRPMLPVALAPLITYPLRWLREGGVGRATICQNRASRSVRGALGDGAALGLELDYLEDWVPRGPAGCVRDATQFDRGCDRFVVVEAATIPGVDLEALLEAHAASGAQATVVVETAPSSGRSLGGRLQPSGVYVLERSALEHVPPLGFQDIKEGLLPALHADGADVRPYFAEDVTPRVLDADTYITINAWMCERFGEVGPVGDGFRPLGDGWVHETAYVDGDARLIGPVVVGPRARIFGNATVVGPGSVGPGAKILDGAVVCRSALWDGAVIGKDAAIDRCLVGDGVEVEAGAELANRLPGGRRPAALQGASFVARIQAAAAALLLWAGRAA